MNALLRDDNDLKNSRQRAVSSLIGWTNMLQPLPDIPFTDKVLILKQAAGPFALLGTVQRSIHVPHLVLPNDSILTVSPMHPPEILNALTRILDELLSPLRRQHADQVEFCSLKVRIIFQLF